MAVFTPISDALAQSTADQFNLGAVTYFKGIAAGIENTNYFLSTDQGDYVLTIFERLSMEQLPFYIELMHHLDQRNIAVPAPQVTSDGKKIIEIEGKPCSIVTKLRGHWEKNPTPAHCAIIGGSLAKMHLAGKDFDMYQPNLRGLNWWQETVPVVLPHIPANLQTILNDELTFQIKFAQTSEYKNLPSGPIHADLFRDNVLFDATDSLIKLGGFIDFYFAGVDKWLFDCAVSVNDWCIDLSSGVINQERAQALLKSYHYIRPFSTEEQYCWPSMLRMAALRFWISRLWDYYLPRPAQTLTPHDPTHFERILIDRRNSKISLPI